MDKESKSGFAGLSGNGMVAVFLVAASAFVLRAVPLEGTRPAADEPRVDQRFAEQDIDARLWQDPFGAMVRARTDTAKKLDAAQLRADEQRHSDTQLREAIAQKANARVDEITVLSVMLPGGPYSEYVEGRRRTRYAVLAGLNAANYAPVDTEHLGYFLPSNNATLPRALPEAVPYEWFELAPDSKDKTKRQVLVLWIDNSAFYFTPFAHFRRLFASLRPSTAAPKLRWQVLGPVGSDGLRAMLDEAANPGFDTRLFDGMPVAFQSFSATVADATLMRPLVNDTLATDHQPLSIFFQSKGISMSRTISDDEKLSKSLTDELLKRGLKTRATRTTPGMNATQASAAYRAMCRVDGPQDPNSPSHVAIVAEWDTLYGRSMRRNFTIGPDDDQGFCVDRFSYVRGLDGKLPERGNTPPSTAEGPKDAAASKDDNRRQDGSFIERAEGQSQFDYLRRLSGRLREKDRQLRMASFDGAGIRAIGVLGNDVHDKLLVLQALRPEFPNTIFFTTDLDARFLHPREQAWARNLIVASTFGLRLNDSLQAGTPPFRDSYQTAAYFATRLALVPGEPVKQARVDEWLAVPRVFEIGRSRPFDFSGPASAADRGTAVRCRSSELDKCADVHPPGSRRYPSVPPMAAVLATSALILLLWFPALALSRSLRKRLRRFVARGGAPAGRRRRRLALATIVLLLQVVLPLLLARQWAHFADWLTRDGKPISFSEGISIWPTEGMHLLTLVLCIYLVFRGWNALTLNLDEISRALRLGKTRRQLVAEQDFQDRSLAWWQKLANTFCLRTPYIGKMPADAASDPRMSPGTLAFWKQYIVQNRASSRFVRSSACVLVVVTGYVLLHHALAESTGLPQRGPISASVHLLIGFAAVVVMNFLVFWVADATLFCVRFVRDLRLKAANWPERTERFFQARIGALPPSVLDHWIDLQFVAHRTRCVTRLIYYPFVVLSLLLLSRSPVFDNWQLPVAVLAMVVLSIAVVLACAVALRWTTEQSREQALNDVRDARLLAHSRGLAGSPEAEQLGLLQKRMEELNEGAFAPFSQQPLLKAVLLPFATFGGTSLLDFVTLANV